MSTKCMKCGEPNPGGLCRDCEKKINDLISKNCTDLVRGLSRCMSGSIKQE